MNAVAGPEGSWRAAGGSPIGERDAKGRRGRGNQKNRGRGEVSRIKEEEKEDLLY